MRSFFLRDKILTSCGTSKGGKGGIAYFCPSCGEIWGRVAIGWMDWMAATIFCAECGRGRISATFSPSRSCPGSFLKPLVWWDESNGNTLAKQLDLADSSLLLYEAERHIDWILPPLSTNESER